MRQKFVLSILLLLLGLPLLAESRLQTLAGELSDKARALSEDGYDGFRRRDRGNRADVEALYSTIQFQSGADLFRRMVEDDRPESELRDSVLILRTQLTGMSRYGFGRIERDDMGRLLQNIERELGLGGRSPEWRDRDSSGAQSGALRWSGRVDDEVILLVRGARVSVRVVKGDRVEDEDYYFESPLPRRNTNLSVRKLRGRGSVDVVEQPSRQNNYSATIRIRDSRSGSEQYELEVSWRE